ncbi:hypothetical protein [Arthrobacter sp. SD76]|uniref:hypothetical protein n=1 Tax=Arthrobacter sp. SD76 TaxID=3415007 RepID=UPI003C7673CF
MNSVHITMIVVAVCVVIVACLIVRESRQEQPADGHLCPTCGHEYSGDDAGVNGVGDLVRRALKLAPLPEYRCTEVSREWEATAQGNMDCDCTDPFHKPRYSLAA